MPADLTNVEAFTDPVSVPVDGDVRNAASVETPFQALTNRTWKVFQMLTKTPGRVTMDAETTQIRYLSILSASPGGLGQPLADNFNVLTTGGLMTHASSAPSSRIYLDLTPHLMRWERIARIRVLADPGAARATTSNRINVLLKNSSYGVSFSSVTMTHNTLVTVWDDGTSSAQWITIDLASSPVQVSNAQTWFLDVKMGNDCNVNLDSIRAVAYEVLASQIGNG